MKIINGATSICVLKKGSKTVDLYVKNSSAGLNKVSFLTYCMQTLDPVFPNVQKMYIDRLSLDDISGQIGINVRDHINDRTGMLFMDMDRFYRYEIKRYKPIGAPSPFTRFVCRMNGLSTSAFIADYNDNKLIPKTDKQYQVLHALYNLCLYFRQQNRWGTLDLKIDDICKGPVLIDPIL